MIYKSCPRCGKIHRKDYVCRVGMVYRGGDERKMRSSNQWKEKSIEIRERAQWMCEWCKAHGRFTTGSLEVHHIQKIKNTPTLLCEDSNLICLCQSCHERAESGEISVEELKQLVEERDANIPHVF